MPLTQALSPMMTLTAAANFFNWLEVRFHRLVSSFQHPFFDKGPALLVFFIFFLLPWTLFWKSQLG